MDTCGPPPGNATDPRERGGRVLPLPQPATAVSSAASGNVAVARNGKRKAEDQGKAEPRKYIKTNAHGGAKAAASTDDEHVARPALSIALVAEIAYERQKRVHAEELLRLEAKAHSTEVSCLQGKVASATNQLKMERKIADGKDKTSKAVIAFAKKQLELEKKRRIAQVADARRQTREGHQPHAAYSLDSPSSASASLAAHQELLSQAMNDTATSGASPAKSTSSAFTSHSMTTEDTSSIARLAGVNATDKRMADSDDE